MNINTVDERKMNNHRISNSIHIEDQMTDSDMFFH